MIAVNYSYKNALLYQREKRLQIGTTRVVVRSRLFSKVSSDAVGPRVFRILHSSRQMYGPNKCFVTKTLLVAS